MEMVEAVVKSSGAFGTGIAIQISYYPTNNQKWGGGIIGGAATRAQTKA